MAQTLNLITTKLHIPKARSNLVARPRLNVLLDQIIQTRLTLIAAPAGFGKTTVLTEWCTSKLGKSVPLGWISLDETDQDVALFWAYIITALDKVTPGLVGCLLPLLCSPQLQLEAFVTDLINKLNNTASDFILVLDDYHAINNLAIHNSLLFLLERLPAQMHLVITSRADPPLHLPRLRVRGHLTELRVEDLRFSLEETKAFLQLMHLQLEPEQMQVLEERTEGWIAGLQLAALSMQKRPDVAEFVTAFSGSNRYVLDYVLEEVLQQQSEQIQNFLLFTAILNRLTGPLCEAVTGQSDGQATLEWLERANMFLVGLDDNRSWYRYHHLFAQLLLYRLQQVQPQIIPELYRRAGEWSQSHNLTEEAIYYFLNGEYFEQAAVNLELISRQLVEQGRLSHLTNWVDKLPQTVLNRHPHLYVNYAWALSFSGQVEISRNYLAKVSHAANPTIQEQKADLGTEVNVFQTTILTSYEQDFRQSILLIPQVLAALPPQDLYQRSYVLRDLGEAYLLSGDLQQSEAGYQAAVYSALASNNNFMACAAVYGLGLVKLRQAKLNQAAQLFRSTLQAFEAKNVELPVTSYLYIGHADILREWDELPAALAYVEKALVLAQQGNLNTLLIWGYTLLAKIRQAQGDNKKAVEARFQGLQYLQKYQPAHYHLREAASYTRLLLMQGDLTAADQWASEYQAIDGATAQMYSYLLQEYLDLTLARVWLVQGKAHETLSLLEELQKKVRYRQDLSSIIEIGMLQALALFSSGSHNQAVEVLINLLKLAEPAGYIRLFVDMGNQIRLLLKAVQAESTLSVSLRNYTKRLLQRLEGQKNKSKPYLTQAPISEVLPFDKTEPTGTLTERELEVLNLLNIGTAPPEIAQKLVISLDTVKKHIKNIYSKLNAHSRFEAIVRAEKLKLF